ncbi:MAG: hypothetical protein U9P14_03975 [Gemmatimonadota bacterium]|nr:hypothetical protein [Gemmatimonadota bacterium]
MPAIKEPRRLRWIIIVSLIASGLAVVLCENYGGELFPRSFLLGLRTVFWSAAVCYLWLRLAKKI